MEWLFTSKALYGRAVSFAVLLSSYHLKIKRVNEKGVDFAQLLQASITPAIGLDESLRHIAPPAKHSASVRLDPEILYALVPPTFVGLYCRAKALQRRRIMAAMGGARGYYGNCRNKTL